MAHTLGSSKILSEPGDSQRSACHVSGRNRVGASCSVFKDKKGGKAGRGSVLLQSHTGKWAAHGQPVSEAQASETSIQTTAATKVGCT